MQIQPVYKDFPKVLPSQGTNTQKDGNMTPGNTSTGIKRPHQPESEEPQPSAETGKGLEHSRKVLKESSTINYLSIGKYRVFFHFIVRVSFSNKILPLFVVQNQSNLSHSILG